MSYSRERHLDCEIMVCLIYIILMNEQPYLSRPVWMFLDHNLGSARSYSIYLSMPLLINYS